MNFLAHYKLIPKGKSPYFMMGVLLPDLIPGFTKVYHHNIRNNSFEDDESIEMRDGILFHLQTDAIFHNLDLFQDLIEAITIVFKEEDRIKIPRTFFIVHILIELLIDHFLVEENPQLPLQFYKDLDTLNQQKVDSFLTKINSLHPNFISNFENFKKSKYALLLKDNESVYKALKHICFRRIEFNPSEREKILMIERIGLAHHILSDKFKIIIHQMQNKLSKNDQ